jgi:hypothetical protein
MFGADKQQELNAAALANPQPGDYWHEMFCGCFIVLAVTPETVTFCETKIDVDPRHWTWDVSKTSRVLREEFSKRLHYGSMPDKTWCDIGTKRHLEFVEEFNRLQPA